MSRDTISFEQWLHASDDERQAALAAWEAEPEAGRAIVTAVAVLFQRECIYEVEAAEAATDGGRWVINAFLGPDEFALLSGRKPTSFLGVPVRFHRAGGQTTH